MFRGCPKIPESGGNPRYPFFLLAMFPSRVPCVYAESPPSSACEKYYYYDTTPATAPRLLVSDVHNFYVEALQSVQCL